MLALGITLMIPSSNSRSVTEEVHGKLIAYLKMTARGAIIERFSGIITSIEDGFATVASLSIYSDRLIASSR